MPEAGGGSDGGRRPDAAEDLLARLFRSSHANAVLGWLLIGVLLVTFLESVLDVDRGWMAFVAVTGIIVLIPPLAYREWRVMLPWELLVIALLPVLVRGVFGGTVGAFATYLALAGVALIVTAELHMFTSLRVTHWFAVAFVVLATMATVATWTIFRWHADRLFGTAYLADNETLMMEWLYVVLAGVAAGVLFDGYFKRRDRRLWRTIRRSMAR